MSNHIHIILQSETNKLSDTIKEFKSLTAKKILKTVKTDTENRRDVMLNIFEFEVKRHKRNEHYQIWRHDNHPELIFSNHFLDQKINYIHDNPIKAGIVGQQEDYLYSSARDYAGEKGLVEIFLFDPPLKRLGNMRSIW